MHTPVLLQEAIEALAIKKGGKYIDATVGEGGHLREIIDKGGQVLGLDWDKSQIEHLKSQVKSPNVTFAVGNYADIETIANEHQFSPVDGILFDFGLSMEQLNNSGKGFSFKQLDEPLDMRLGDKTEESAADLVNRLNEDELFNLFARFSEEIHSREIAKQIIISRVHNKVIRVGDFLQMIDKALKNCEQSHDHSKTKAYTRIFQALRIAVNGEFENIKKGLQGAINIITPEGRIVIISFHSGEDRIVKQFARGHGLKFIDQKFIAGDRDKSFERSAKLRIISK